MSRPAWRLVGPPVGDWGAWIRTESARGHIISVGPGTRIEYISPHHHPCWAEGSRYIEGRREASKMRHRAWQNWEHRRMVTMLNLGLISHQLAMLQVSGLD